MKCQHCEKPAAFHITELTGDEIQEIHLCEDHARHYLSQGEPTKPKPPTLGGAVGASASIGHTAEELSRLDQQACPVCGITFFEFRNVGRLGCPHDYECFATELEPLIVSIHGETSHMGKIPKRATRRTKVQTELIRLRREMKEAVESEDYERASQIRDQIQELQQQSQAATETEPLDDQDELDSETTADQESASKRPATRKSKKTKKPDAGKKSGTAKSATPKPESQKSEPEKPRAEKKTEPGPAPDSSAAPTAATGKESLPSDESVPGEDEAMGEDPSGGTQRPRGGKKKPNPPSA